MKQTKKTLALLVVLALAITAIFALAACKEDPAEPTVESITVEIIGGGNEIALTQQNATADAIKGKIKVTANLSDETTKAVEAKDYTLEGFDATKLNVAQTVTVKYGEFTKTVSVKVAGSTEPDPKPVVTVTSIEVAIANDAEKVVLAAADATVANLKAAITVTLVKSDNTKQVVTDYTVEGFNDEDEFATDEDITVTIKHSEKTATVTLVIEAPAPVIVSSIAVTPAAVELESGADEAALKAAITVTATLSDENTETVAAADYEIEGFDASETEEQTVTVKYEGKEATVKVTVKPAIEVLASVVLKAKFDKAVPDSMHVFIAIQIDKTPNAPWLTTEMTANADRTEFSKTIENVAVDTYSFLVTISDTDQMSYDIKYGKDGVLMANDDASVIIPSQATEVNLFGETELAAPAEKEDLKNVTLQITFNAPIKSTCKVYIVGTLIGGWDPIEMTANTARTVFTYKLDEVKTGNYEYKVGFGATFSWDDAIGQYAPWSGGGNAQLELKPADDGQTVKLFVDYNDGVMAAAAKFVDTLEVKLTVNDGEAITLTPKTAGSTEYMVLNLELKAEDVVTITINGVAYTYWKNGVAFDTTVAEDGSYDFYVQVCSGDAGIWVQKSAPAAE